MQVAVNLSKEEIPIDAKRVIFGEGYKKAKNNILLQNGGFILF